MKIGKLGYLSFSMLLAGVVACGGDDGGGGGDDDGTTDDGTTDDGTTDDGTGDDDDGTGVDAGGDGADADPAACLSAPREVANEKWTHVAPGTEITYANEPPSSGPHYTVWATWDVHFEVARGHYVHNLEHGGIVLVHRPDAPDEVAAALRAAYDAIPDDPECGHKRAILAQDPELAMPVAVIAADWVMTGSCLDEDDQDAILDFAAERRGLGPEDICDEGTIQ
jgi:hypothetical protein